jgi:hypothetical protein
MMIISDCDSFYEDSLVHLLHCLPLPNPMLRHRPLPSRASSHSTSSFATATSTGSSNVDYLKMSPTWLQPAADLAFPETLTPITEPPNPNLESPTAISEGPVMTNNGESPVPINEAIPGTIPKNATSLPDGHPGNMI